jgi:hypothetical protein
MTLRKLTLIVLMFSSCLFRVEAAQSAADQVFDRLKKLAGEWEGTFEWSQGRTASGTLKAVYHVTGNGSALVEDLIMDGVPMMTSVYHLDGLDLRMTHYCAAKNQPRLKAVNISPSATAIDFGFVDVTNADASKTGYVNAFRIELSDTNEIKLRFTFGGGSGTGPIENIVLKRRSPGR